MKNKFLDYVAIPPARPFLGEAVASQIYKSLKINILNRDIWLKNQEVIYG